jgi:5-methylcytosine-specific restriction endonuclease McrA
MPKPKLQGRKRPDHAEKMRALWTPERREAKRQEMLTRNPNARYHGLSCKAARRLRQSVGACQSCGHGGSRSRLEVHHLDRDKRNQEPSNLMVLCHDCHMREHQEAGETGWSAYHAKRRSGQD